MSTESKIEPQSASLKRIVRLYDREYYRESLLSLMRMFKDVRFRRGMNQAAISMGRITQEEWHDLEQQIKARVPVPTLPPLPNEKLMDGATKDVGIASDANAPFHAASCSDATVRITKTKH